MARFQYARGFLLFFVYIYLGMCALGLALEAMITILTPRFVPFFLVLLVSNNTYLHWVYWHGILALDYRECIDCGPSTWASTKPIPVWSGLPILVSFVVYTQRAENIHWHFLVFRNMCVTVLCTVLRRLFNITHREQAVRAIIFNTTDHLGRNAGVLIAWISLSCFTLSGLVWYMRREVRDGNDKRPRPGRR